MKRIFIPINRLISILLFTVFLIIYSLSGNSHFSNLSIALLSIDVILLIILEYKINIQICCPLIVWYVFWLLFIVIARFKNIYYSLLETTWSDELIRIVLINTAVFYYVYIIFDIGSIKENDKQENIKTNKKYNFQFIYKIIVIAFIIAVFSFCLNVIYIGAIPQFTTNPNYYRIIFVKSGLFKVFNTTRFLFLIIPFVIENISEEKKKRLYLITVVLYLMQFLTAWRGYLVESIFMFISVYLLINKKENIISYLKYLIPFAIIIFILIGYISITRSGGKLTFNNIYNATIKNIYMYIAPNFINLKNEMKVVVPVKKFIYTTQAFWKLFISPQTMGIKDIQQSIGPYNISPYLFLPFADFGIVGTVIWTTVFSIISSLSYKIYILKNNMFSCTMVGFMNMIISMMHNGFLMISICPYLWIIIVYMLLRYAKISDDSGKFI